MRSLFLLSALLLVSVPISLAQAEDVSFEDPENDDDGPGSYIYPTDPVYAKGSFDLREVEIEDDGDDIKITIKIDAKIEDPWNSQDWDGNGFSLQFAQLYLDLDHQAGSGFCEALPGMNVNFADESCWEKVILISPQPATRIRSEVDEKAPSFKDGIIIPRSTKASGKKLTAIVNKSDLGAEPSKGWGYQVLMQSNEGFPDKADLLTRKVNEYEGQHRFGGGSDFECDPHVIDLLAGKGKGESDEIEAQHKMLGTFTCDEEGNGTRATIEMVYP